MKYIVQDGFDRYIDELIEAPTHPGAVEIPEDLARRFNDLARELAVMERQVREFEKAARVHA